MILKQLAPLLLLTPLTSAFLSREFLARHPALRTALKAQEDFDRAGLVFQGQRGENLEDLYPAQTFEQRVNHFDKHSNATFEQRYWVNDKYYKPGGPVLVLDGGETSGADRLPFLDHGIIKILAEVTGGLAIVLEHRYYGKSIPVKTFSTDNLRFLNNSLALQDSAEFIKHVKPRGISHSLSPADGTRWIYYGGSYAGARAAHMRKLYPDLVFGGIASSAVTHADVLYWQYMDIIRTNQDPECIANLQEAILAIDTVLDLPVSLPHKVLKSVFGLGDLSHNTDFVDVISSPLGGVQSRNWDPAVSSTVFDDFCAALSTPNRDRSFGLIRIPALVLNYGKFIKDNVVSQCPEGMTVEECFGTYGEEDLVEDEHDFSNGRAWGFQVCTQWGYFQGAPPDPEYPRIVSKRLTLDYTSKFCHKSYPPGKHYCLPEWPAVHEVNDLGDFSLSYSRLAFIDGEDDPWKPATPHSDRAPLRNDTISEPFKVIPHGTHHWDENGLKDPSKEPRDIKEIHAEMVAFVKAWLAEKDGA